MTTAVLQTHHAVQTLPEVSPEFTQAIVQTDISGPITASELANADLTHTAIGKSVAESELRDDMPSTVDDTNVDSNVLDGHGGVTAELQVEEAGDKGVQTIKQSGEFYSAVMVTTEDDGHKNLDKLMHNNTQYPKKTLLSSSPQGFHPKAQTTLTTLQESTAQKLLFEWSHFRISV